MRCHRRTSYGTGSSCNKVIALPGIAAQGIIARSIGRCCAIAGHKIAAIDKAVLVGTAVVLQRYGTVAGSIISIYIPGTNSRRRWAMVNVYFS